MRRTYYLRLESIVHIFPLDCHTIIRTNTTSRESTEERIEISREIQELGKGYRDPFYLIDLSGVYEKRESTSVL